MNYILEINTPQWGNKIIAVNNNIINLLDAFWIPAALIVGLIVTLAILASIHFTEPKSEDSAKEGKNLPEKKEKKQLRSSPFDPNDNCSCVHNTGWCHSTCSHIIYRISDGQSLKCCRCLNRSTPTRGCLNCACVFHKNCA